MICRNNLRQIGIAIQIYSTTLEVLPPGQYSFDGKSYNEVSPFLKILPQMDNAVTYNAYNYLHMDRLNSPRIENRTVMESNVGSFLCPSDIGPTHLSSYVFNVGQCIYLNGSATNNGPFGLFKMLRPEQMRNGISLTAFASERIAGSFENGNIKPSIDFKNISFSSIKHLSDGLTIPLCENTKSDNWYSESGKYWLYWSPLHTAYSHSSLPNDKRSACGGMFFGILPARSNHASGVHVLFGDSHTEKVSSSISSQVWEGLGTCY